MKNFRRLGFTLVELLIVIVVIGVLSTMLILTAENAIASSKAVAIVNNLTNLKKAVLFWMTDNEDKVVWQNGQYLVRYKNENSPVQEFWESRKGKEYRNTSDFKTEILRYMGNSSLVGVSGAGGEWSAADKGGAGIKTGAYRLNDDDPPDKKVRDVWYIGYVIGEGQNALKKALASRAQNLNLLQENRKYSKPYTDSDIVWMKILDLTNYSIKK